MTLSPTSGTENTGVTAKITKCVPGELMQFVFESKPKVLGAGITDAAGDLTFGFKVPNNAEPGDHNVAASSLDGLAKANAKFTVAADKVAVANTGGTAAGASPGKLAATGVNSKLNWGGLLFLSLGLVAMALLTFRRSKDPEGPTPAQQD